MRKCKPFLNLIFLDKKTSKQTRVPIWLAQTCCLNRTCSGVMYNINNKEASALICSLHPDPHLHSVYKCTNKLQVNCLMWVCARSKDEACSWLSACLYKLYISEWLTVVYRNDWLLFTGMTDCCLQELLTVVYRNYWLLFTGITDCCLHE